MLRLFQSTNPFSFLLLLIYAVGVNAHALMHPVAVHDHTYSYISNWLLLSVLHIDALPLQLLHILQLALVTGTGIWLSMLMQKYKLISKPSLVPAVTFVLLCSFFPDILNSVPEILCGLITIRILFSVFSAYNKQRCDLTYFDAALLSGLAVLLYPPSGILLLFSMLALLRMRSTTFREFMIYIIGVCTVAWLTGTALFWVGELETFRNSWQEQWHYFMDPAALLTTPLIVKTSLIGLVFFMALILYFEKISSNLIQIRRYMTVFLWLFLASLLALGFGATLHEGSYYLLCIPVAMVISYYLFHSKQVLYTEGAHATLLIATILMQYITFA